MTDKVLELFDAASDAAQMLRDDGDSLARSAAIRLERAIVYLKGLRQENKRVIDLLKMSSDSSFEISADMARKHEAEIERLGKMLKDMRNAIDMMEGALMRWPELVDLPEKWGRHGAPRHHNELGVNIPGNCGQVYGVCDALAELTRIINSDEYNVK